jgi:hypothetical protein
MMRKMTAAEARKLDWQEFPDSRPREGVVYPKGQERASLIARLRKAFARAKLKQTA